MFIALLKKEKHNWIARAINAEKGIDVVISNLSIPFTLWEIVKYKDKPCRIININGKYEIKNLTTEEIFHVEQKEITSSKRPIKEDVYFIEEQDNKFIICDQFPSFNTKNICKDVIFNKFKSKDSENLLHDLLMFKCYSETNNSHFYQNSLQTITYGNYTITKPYER